MVNTAGGKPFDIYQLTVNIESVCTCVYNQANRHNGFKWLTFALH